MIIFGFEMEGFLSTKIRVEVRSHRNAMCVRSLRSLLSRVFSRRCAASLLSYK